MAVVTPLNTNIFRADFHKDTDVTCEFDSLSQISPFSCSNEFPVSPGSYPKNAYEIKDLLSEKFLAHLFGDSFIEGTNLQGMYPEDALMHMILMLKEQRSQFAVENEISALETAVEIRGIFSQLRVKWNSEAEKRVGIKEFSTDLSCRIKNLAIGEKFLISGGYETHAVLYEFIRTSQDTFDFVLYNTGSGVQRHWFYMGNPSGFKAQAAYRIFDVDIEKITRIRFLEELCKLEFKEEEEFIEVLYEELIPDLEGIREKMPTNYSEFMTPQRSGTCAWKVLCAYLRYNMPLDEYKHLILKAKLDVFEKLYKIRYVFDFREVAKSLLVKLGLKHEVMMDYNKDELLALCLLKLENSLKKYSHLLNDEELNRAKQLMNYFFKANPKNSDQAHLIRV